MTDCTCSHTRGNAIDPTPRAAARPGPHHWASCPKFQTRVGDIPGTTMVEEMREQDRAAALSLGIPPSDLPSDLRPGVVVDRLVIAALVAGRREGAAAELALVLAWLRANAGYGFADEQDAIRWVTEQIAALEHRKQP